MSISYTNRKDEAHYLRAVKTKKGKFRYYIVKNREKYAMQRFCNLSRYYGWITMETSNDLAYLAEKYCYHIDKESLLEFWIEGEEDDWQPEMVFFRIEGPL